MLDTFDTAALHANAMNRTTVRSVFLGRGMPAEVRRLTGRDWAGRTSATSAYPRDRAHNPHNRPESPAYRADGSRAKRLQQPVSGSTASSNIRHDKRSCHGKTLLEPRDELAYTFEAEL
ncbi:hypothetical protein AC579_5365 [Pseudocercospora musae]|uniref:Uncharacterized protein n=1 Tax=Pseudocercospora musae TaxID=113226 RepID=A0A139ISV6_9PEZI|nr:hypothetical protein AC579_5365 [Pseudocercospora musae]